MVTSVSSATTWNNVPSFPAGQRELLNRANRLNGLSKCDTTTDTVSVHSSGLSVEFLNTLNTSNKLSNLAKGGFQVETVFTKTPPNPVKNEPSTVPTNTSVYTADGNLIKISDGTAFGTVQAMSMGYKYKLIDSKAGDPIDTKSYAAYANFLEENQYDPEVTKNIWYKMQIEKSPNPVQEYFDEHNIDMEAECKKYMTKCGVDNEEDLKALASTPFQTRDELTTVTAREISSMSSSARLWGLPCVSISQEEAQQMLSSSSVTEFPMLYNNGLGKNGPAIEMKNYFEKLISEDKISDELKGKLTKLSSSITTMVDNDMLGKDPFEGKEKYRISLISKYTD